MSQKKDRIENNDKIRLSISSPTITHSNNNDNKYSISSGKGKSATFSSGSIFTTTATSPRRLRDTTSTPSEKIYTVIYMTSGSGSPRNQSHSHTGNSTLEASKMLGIFMQSMFPFVHPVSVHSGGVAALITSRWIITGTMCATIPVIIIYVRLLIMHSCCFAIFFSCYFINTLTRCTSEMFFECAI